MRTSLDHVTILTRRSQNIKSPFLLLLAVIASAAARRAIPTTVKALPPQRDMVMAGTGTGTEVENTRVTLKHYVTTSPAVSDMEIKSSRISLSLHDQKAQQQDVLVENLFLSPDPYMRSRMLDLKDSYFSSFIPGQPLTGFGVSKVLLSNHPNFKPGDIVTGITSWENYSVINGGSEVRKIADTDLPLSYHVGVLGMPGITAYAGFFEICAPKAGEEVFVSAASGAVGQLVGQFAKITGCRVVGSAGSDEKVKLLKEKLGFDDAFNYKTEPDLSIALKRCFPNGIDIYFDNVGGKMLSAVLLNMKVFARISVCGMISEPLGQPGEGVHNLTQLLVKRIRMQGFIVSDYYHLREEFTKKVTDYLKEGKIIYIEDFMDGIENAPAAFIRMLEGKNIGKQVVRL